MQGVEACGLASLPAVTSRTGGQDSIYPMPGKLTDSEAPSVPTAMSPSLSVDFETNPYHGTRHEQASR